MKRLLACLALLAGCPAHEDGAPCARHSDCASNVCSAGTCHRADEPAPDALEPDASTTIPTTDAGVDPDAEGL